MSHTFFLPSQLHIEEEENSKLNTCIPEWLEIGQDYSVWHNLVVCERGNLNVRGALPTFLSSQVTYSMIATQASVVPKEICDKLLLLQVCTKGFKRK